jgi:hypothetical protein
LFTQLDASQIGVGALPGTMMFAGGSLRALRTSRRLR